MEKTMFQFMKKMVMTAVMFGLVFGQSPIIRVKQLGNWDSPQTWWKNSVTQDLDDFLAQDTNNQAFDNNNFDSWRDKVLEMEVTLDDVGEDITTLRFDIAFDNDLVTWIESGETSVNAWSQGDSKVVKGSHISGWTEGDESSNADYSFEVVHFSNVGYQDSLAVGGSNTLVEESIADTRYDWLRVTMVSHGVDADSDGTPDKTFGNGDGEEVQVIKFFFKINDVVDDFAPRAFRIPTFYDGTTGYYTFVSDDYLLDYKVYIDGNWGHHKAADRTFNGAARGDITLHPKLVDVEGYMRYIGEYDGTNAYSRNKYSMMKVIFELDETNPDNLSNWRNPRDINYPSSNTDESLTDDVMGSYDDAGTFALGYQHMRYYEQNAGTTSDQKIQNDGFRGVSYWYWTYTDDKGYFNVSLPRNNRYRVSFWPPEADDVVGDHTTYLLDRGAITNISDAIASFNFQSNKFENEDDIDIATPSAYLIGDVDGDDKFQLNDTYFLWAYTSGVFDTDYTHYNGETYQQWSSIDNLKSGNNDETLNYYQAHDGSTRNQRREFSIFVDDDLAQETAELTSDGGGVIYFNPLMDDVQTGLDTLSIKLGAGSSTFGSDVNPDYLFKTTNASKQVDIVGTDNDSDIAYYFTGDMNLTGLKVDNNGTAITPTKDGTTFYRWGTGTAPTEWARTSSPRTIVENPDVRLSLPADGSVKVQMGNQVVVPLTITPIADEMTGEVNKIAGYEFEVRFKADQLQFLDAQTGLLPGPWMTYLNESEIDDEGYKTISFGSLENSPNNAPIDYYITEELVGLQLVFQSLISENNPDEWITADLQFVGKYAAGNPNGDDLLMERQSGNIRIWNKYWAFGGGRPDEDELTYVYPNPFIQSEHTDINFQFFMELAGDVTISIYNINGQKISTIFEDSVQEGLHNFKFDELPESTDPQFHSGYKNLESGIYVFLMETDNKIKTKKFTILK
jgi:flagellar hook assembly protein FlgD